MRAFLLAGAAALALSGTAVAQSSTPGVIGSPQHSAQSGTTPMGGADVGRSGSVNMGSGHTTTGTAMGGSSVSSSGMAPRSSAGMSSSRSSGASASRRSGGDVDPPATAAQIRREEARQMGARAARPTRPEDRAYMGGGVILENGRPVGMGEFAGSASMPTNAMGGSMGAIQPGPAGRMGSGNNAGTTPGGGR